MKLLLLLLSFSTSNLLSAQDMKPLVEKLKFKLQQVSSYEADGKLKTNISFIKAPIGKVHIYFKKPNKFKLVRQSGISILPKGGMTFQLNTLLDNNDYMALDAGESTIDNTKVKIIKLLPNNENSDIILTTLFIDEDKLLIKKANTTTKENGSFEMTMTYGKYQQYALPDKVLFSFNTKDYKIPKGVTLEFDDAQKPTEADKLKKKKGTVEITYSNYVLNATIDDKLFDKN